MTLQTRKSDLKTQVNRYITLLSNLAAPDHEFIQSLDYFKGLVDFANQKEISGLESRFLAIKPSDSRSVRYIDTGRLDDAPGLVQTSDIIKVMTLRGGPTSGNWGHKGRPGKHGGSLSGGGHASLGLSRDVVQGAKKRGAAKAREIIKRESEKRKVISTFGAVPLDPAQVAQAKATIDRAAQERGKTIRKYYNDRDYQTMRKAIHEEDKLNDRLNINNEKLRDLQQKEFDKGKLTKAEYKQRESLYARNGKIREKRSVVQERRDKATDKLQEKLRSGELKMPGESDKRYLKETDEAHEILFQHNLNEAKRVRAEIALRAPQARQANKLDDLTKEQARLAKVEEAAFDASMKARKKYNETVDTGDQAAIERANKAWGKAHDNWIQTSVKHAEVANQYQNLKKDDRELFLELTSEGVTPTRIKRKDTGEPPSDRKRGSKKTSAADEWDTGERVFNTMVDENTFPPGIEVEFQGMKGWGRAYASGNVIALASSNEYADTVVHELGHVLELTNARVSRKAKDFLERRTKNEETTTMAAASGNDAYGDDEVTKKDRFINPYIGKQYSHRSTEVISMGLQMMYDTPSELAHKDPEMFDLIYAVTRSG